MALVVATSMAVLAACLMQISGASLRARMRALDTKCSFYLAEAGLAEAYAGLCVGKTGNVGTREAPARLGEGLFWVEATPIDDESVQLVCTGMRGLGRAVLSLVAEKGEESVASLGVFSTAPLTISPGTRISGFDSSQVEPPPAGGAPAEVTGRLGSNGPVALDGTLKQPTVVKADAIPGPREKVTLGPGVTHVGSRTPREAAESLPPVEVPFEPTQPGVTQKKGKPLVLSGESIGLAFLQVNASGQVVIQGPCDLVLGSLNVKANGELVFDTQNGPVSMWVKESMELGNKSRLNCLGGDPSQLTIQLASAKAASMLATGRLDGVLFAPSAEVRIGAALACRGALVASKLTIDPGANLAFDSHLDQVAAQMALPKLVSWRIVELATESSAEGARDPFTLLEVDRSDLPYPAAAHQDQQIEVRYENQAHVASSYSGLESGFDWTKVTKVTSLLRDGEPVVLPPETPPPAPTPPSAVMNALSGNPLLKEDQLKKLLKDSSPLSSAEIVGAIGYEPWLSSGKLEDVLKRNVPLGSVELNALLDRGQPMKSGDLKHILEDSSPLPPDIQARLAAGDGGLELNDLLKVLKLQ